MTERKGVPYAVVTADRRERHRSRGCAGDQHVMRRGLVGPDDRPWRCVAEGCSFTQAWSGGIAGWIAAHTPPRPAGDDQVPGQAELPLGLLGLLRGVR